MVRNRYAQNITPEEVISLAPVRFEGRIVVVENLETAEMACRDLMSHSVVGFDTETRPTFKPGALNKVALLQLSTPDTCYLIRLCRMALEKPILKVLESRKTVKVGADITNDIKALQQLRHFKPGGFVDLQLIASEWGIAEKSVRKLSAIVLGKRVSKAQRLTNWEAASLTDSQCSYAATDAWVCLRMYRALMETEKNPLPAPEPAPAKDAKTGKRKYPGRKRRVSDQGADAGNKTDSGA